MKLLKKLVDMLKDACDRGVENVPGAPRELFGNQFMG